MMLLDVDLIPLLDYQSGMLVSKNLISQESSKISVRLPFLCLRKIFPINLRFKAKTYKITQFNLNSFHFICNKIAGQFNQSNQCQLYKIIIAYMTKPFQQFYLRADIAELNQQLNVSDHNVKAFRKKSTSRSRKKSETFNTHISSLLINSNQKGKSAQKFTKVQEQTAVATQRGEHFLNIETNEEYLSKVKSYQKTTMDRTNPSNSKRLSVTQGMSRRDKQELSVKKIFGRCNQPTNTNIQTQRMSTHAIQELNNKERDSIPTSKGKRAEMGKIVLAHEKQQNLNGNKFAELQKASNKHPLKMNYVQNWLNNILIQYCSQEKFDMTIENPALKKYSIDTNSLLAQSLNFETIHRIYKSLFIYSIGFNNLLKQLTGKNVSMMKTLWKVYAILLQYCAEGNFESMVAQIQRDKKKKLESLKVQIEKRQKFIDEMDITYKQKNAKTFKQLRTLKQQNQTLISDKQQLDQELKRTQKALSDQVSLRLRFQNKINEIHGVHKQLTAKHSALYDSFKILQQEKRLKDLQLDSFKNKHIDIKHQYQESCKKIALYLKEVAQKDSIIQLLEEEKNTLKKQIIEHKNKQTGLSTVIQQRDRRNCQLKGQLDSVETSLRINTQSGNCTSNDYQKSLRENQNCQVKIQQQLKQIGELLKQRKIAKEGNLELQALLHVQKQKSENRLQEINCLKALIRDLNSQILENKIEIESAKKTCQIFEKDLNCCHQSIIQMKICKTQVQDELADIRKVRDAFDDLAKQKDQKVLACIKQIAELQAANQDLIVKIKQIESKKTLLQKKISSDEQMYKKKIEFLQKQRDLLEISQVQKSNQIQILKQQAQTMRQLYKNTLQQVKNERFERVNLDLRYKQSLRVLQNESGQITELNRNISEIVNQTDQATRKAKTSEYLLLQTTKTLNSQKSKLEDKIRDLKDKMKFMETFPHPMIEEDLKGKIIRFQIKVKSMELQQSQLKEQLRLAKQANKNIEKQLSQKNQSLIIEFNGKMLQKQSQIQYLQQKVSHLQQSLQKIESLGQQKAKRNSITMNNEKQSKYLTTIKQKTKQIDTLIKQLEILEDHNSRMKQDMVSLQENMNKKIRQSQAVIDEVEFLRKQKVMLQKQKLDLQIQKQKSINQHQNQIAQLLATVQPKNGRKKSTDFQQYPTAQLKQQYFSKQKIEKQSSQQRKRSADASKRKDIANKIKGAVMYYKPVQRSH